MRITLVDFAIQDMKQLPKLPTKQQHLKVLRSLVALNKLIAKVEGEQNALPKAA